jgi:hypothetical protein
MIRMLLALAVVGLVGVTAMRMLRSQTGMQPGSSAELGGARSPADAALVPGAAGAVVAPRAVVDQAAKSVQQALQDGAAAQAARASEAGR